jgi:hypothetical protein
MRPRSRRCTHLDFSRAERLQRFASCFLSAAVPGDASIVNQERKRRVILFEPTRSMVDKRSGATHSTGGEHEASMVFRASCSPVDFLRDCAGRVLMASACGRVQTPVGAKSAKRPGGRHSD